MSCSRYGKWYCRLGDHGNLCILVIFDEPAAFRWHVLVWKLLMIAWVVQLKSGRGKWIRKWSWWFILYHHWRRQYRREDDYFVRTRPHDSSKSRSVSGEQLDTDVHISRNVSGKEELDTDVVIRLQEAYQQRDALLRLAHSHGLIIPVAVLWGEWVAPIVKELKGDATDEEENQNVEVLVNKKISQVGHSKHLSEYMRGI